MQKTLLTYLHLHSNLVILLSQNIKNTVGEWKKFTFQFGDFTILNTIQEHLTNFNNLHSNLVILLCRTDYRKIRVNATFTFQFGDFTIGLILYIEITML